MNSDHRVDALVRDSLAASQENLYSVEKSTVSHSQERTENGTGLTRGTLQNESQELEMQGNPLGAVIKEPYHLPECPQFCDGKPPKCRGGDCTLCDEVDCYCSRLRACEQRVTERWESLRGWGESYAYKTGSDNGFLIGYSAALNAAEAAVREVYRFGDYGEHFIPSEPERVAIHLEEAVAAIRALKETP